MSLWHLLFSLVAYLSGALCLASALRHAPTEGWAKALREVLLFLFFVLAYWLFESWATYLTSYYGYPPAFWDTVPYFDWSPWAGAPWMPPPHVDPICTTLPGQEHGISLSVPVMEASLTYAMMWTARLLAPRFLLLQPFLVGLGTLTLDAFLDPVCARSLDCAISGELKPGLGFWEWHVHDGLGLRWFRIPLFNFAAWFAAPIALVAFTLLIGWARDFLRWVRDVINGVPSLPPSVIDGLLRAIIFFAFGLLFAVAPSGPETIEIKERILIGTVIASLVAVYLVRQSLVRSNAWRWEFVLPQLLFHGFSLVALLLAGAQPLFPLLLAGLVLAALGTYYALSPYLGAPAP